MDEKIQELIEDGKRRRKKCGGKKKRNKMIVEGDMRNGSAGVLRDEGRIHNLR